MKTTLVYSNIHRNSLVHLFHGNKNLQAVVIYIGKVSSPYLVDRVIIRENTGKLLHVWTGSGAYNQALNYIS